MKNVRGVYLLHWTPICNLPIIRQHGLLTTLAQGAFRIIWLCTPENAMRVLKHLKKVRAWRHDWALLFIKINARTESSLRPCKEYLVSIKDIIPEDIEPTCLFLRDLS